MGRARIAGSVALLVIGTTLILMWAFSVTTVRSIEDGTAGNRLAATALTSPDFGEVLAGEVNRVLRERVDDPRGQAALVVLERPIHEAVVTIASSDVVGRLIIEGGDRVQDRLLAEVSEPHREPAPFELRLDVSERVNARLSELPIVGEALPAVSLPVLTVEVMSAESFEDLRGTVRLMTAIATWGLWLAIAAILGGIVLAPQWRTFGSRALGIVGAVVVGVALLLGSMGPATLASLMPGGREGGAGVLIEDVLGSAALGPIAELVLGIGLALVLCAVAWTVVRSAYGRSQRRNALAGGAVDLRTTSS